MKAPFLRHQSGLDCIFLRFGKICIFSYFNIILPLLSVFCVPTFQYVSLLNLLLTITDVSLSNYGFNFCRCFSFLL